jgi:hypothetical protein
MNSTSDASATSAPAKQSNSKLSQRTKGGATGVYLKSSPELCYGLGTSSTQMATAQIRCSSGDVYNESISYVPRFSVCRARLNRPPFCSHPLIRVCLTSLASCILHCFCDLLSFGWS